MKVYIGSDHRGFDYKNKILGIFKRLGYEGIDMGTFDTEGMCDYPKVAYAVATHTAKSKNDRGILICMTGLGQAMAANKVKGAYAALCYNAQAAELSRRHNNANVLVLSSKFTKPKDLSRIIQIFLTTKFEGGRHLRRVKQIQRIEKGLKP